MKHGIITFRAIRPVSLDFPRTRNFIRETYDFFFVELDFHFYQNRGTRFSKYFSGFFPFMGIYKLLKIGRVHTIV